MENAIKFVEILNKSERQNFLLESVKLNQTNPKYQSFPFANLSSIKEIDSESNFNKIEKNDHISDKKKNSLTKNDEMEIDVDLNNIIEKNKQLLFHKDENKQNLSSNFNICLKNEKEYDSSNISKYTMFLRKFTEKISSLLTKITNSKEYYMFCSKNQNQNDNNNINFKNSININNINIDVKQENIVFKIKNKKLHKRKIKIHRFLKNRKLDLNSNKRSLRYNILSEDMKKQLLIDAMNMRTIEVAQKYGISTRNVNRWKKMGIKRKKGSGRKYKDPRLEEKILEWYETQDKNKLTTKDFKLKALELSDNKSFRASTGWLTNLKKKYNISFKKN